jgi:hypothetical protein
MPLALDQAHALLIAERSRDVATITEAIEAVTAVNPDTNLLDIEEAFRDAGSPVYLIAKPELTIVISMPAWDRLGMPPQENRYALAGTTGPFMTRGGRRERNRTGRGCPTIDAKALVSRAPRLRRGRIQLA